MAEATEFTIGARASCSDGFCGEVTRLIIDPAAHNANAIKAYQRIGFKPVGVMRRYERGPDGTWHDGLLMDLLAEELT